jgi:tRNA 5-methylaminomethyl-2-thiouridine biosynthesis bifunctional protein
MSDARPGDPGLVWTEQGPRSGRFGDVYFSAEDGLAETRAVFLHGCGLPEAWNSRHHFTVAELGFGTGLNIAALLDLWRRERPAGARLQVFTVEAFPLDVDEAARALSRWPELDPVTELMLARWPERTPGFHRIDLPELHATVDLAVTDVVEALSAWSGLADAWFLDGFAPSTNPAMWSDAVLGLVAARSAPGARLATFTVAGAVRRGLSGLGFAVDKRPGFGRKRERLEAVFAGEPGDRPRPPSVAVLGGGIAGAALSRAFAAQGIEAALVRGPQGASGNPAALVTPRFDAGGGAVAALYAQAFERAVELYARETPEAVLARGVLQLEHQERDRGRFDRIAAQGLWPEDAVARLDPEAAGAALGEPVARGGLRLRDALAVDPAAVLRAWTPEALEAEVAAVRRTEEGWALLSPDGATVVDAEALCLAGGWGLAALTPDLGLTPVRGQASWAEGVAAPGPVAWGGYAVPTRNGVLFGATHDRGDTGVEVRPEDHGRNLDSLARVLPALAARIAQGPIEGRAAVRAVTPDRLPLCGALEPGLFVLGGLGSRGFCTAPLLAEHLAAMATGRPSPLPAPLAALLEPRRRRPT